ncbi:MAG: Pvc16 family protein, partial [Chloroflexota bacterium]
DCCYMLTTWASEPEDEHLLLARCLLALFRNPTIPTEHLVGDMQEQPYEVQAKAASNDKLTNPAEVWSALDNEMRPSVSYVVTVAMDPWDEVTGPAVRTLTLRAGQAEDPRTETLIPGTAVIQSAYIGGYVTRKGEPQANISVALKGTGHFAATDENGRFSLGGLQHGDYTLVAWPEKGKPKESKITIPGKNYDIDM